MPSKDLVLQKLQHGRSKRLRHTVDLVEKQDALLDTGLFHDLINGGYNLAHRVLGNVKFHALVALVRDKRKSKRRLSGMMCHGIADKCDAKLLRNLLHNGCLSDTWRTKQKDRSLPHDRDAVLTIFIFFEIQLYRIFDMLLCLLDIHTHRSRLSIHFPLNPRPEAPA